LLLVHGTTADHSRWTGVTPLLERHFTVYAMDRRGRGASGDTAPYGIMREAEDVGAVVEKVAEAAGERVFVLGHSYGAVCSLEVSLLTDKIRRLILYEPPIPTGLPMYPVGLPDEMQTLIDRGELEPALELFFRQVVRMPEQELAAYRRLPMWQQRIQLAPTIPREMTIDRTYHFDAQRYTNQQVPTLLLLGSESPPMFRQAVEVVASALANSQVVILQGQRHVAMDSDPDLFVGEVRRFLLT
jgi:pimeloyl-ACP methyl ester carboxylesterase